jgi:hypothetical protein
MAARGLALGRADVARALVIFPPREAPRVYINDEAELVGRFRVSRQLDEGDLVMAEDVTQWDGLEPRDVHQDSAWTAFARIGNEITVAFDARRNRGRAMSLVRSATEFLDTAVDCRESQRLGPAIENAFAAAELLVKAQMFLIEDDPTQNHCKRADWWTNWVQLGNAPDGSDQVLEQL